jgi:uncharacterized protein (DUF305 family)
MEVGEPVRTVSKSLIQRWFSIPCFVALALAVSWAPHGGPVEGATPSSECVAVGASSPGANPQPESVTDLEYLDQLLGYEANAIQMASVALQQAQDSQVLRVALRIVESHAGEIQLLKTWRAQWFPDASPFSIVAAESTTSAHECSSGNFDSDFLRSMISQRRAVIAVAEQIVANADHDELRALAGAVSLNWASEIASMQTILDRLESSHLASISNYE